MEDTIKPIRPALKKMSSSSSSLKRSISRITNANKLARVVGEISTRASFSTNARVSNAIAIASRLGNKTWFDGLDDRANVVKEANMFSKAVKMVGFVGVAMTFASSTDSVMTECECKSRKESGDESEVGVSKNKRDGMVFESVVLYQYDVCPFCNKVKAFLDYNNIAYDVVEVNPLTKTEIKKFEHEWKKVPVLVVDGVALYNSRDIIKTVDRRVKEHSGLTKKWFGEKSEKEMEKEEVWCKWIDDRFVHVLTPNIYKTFTEAFASFDYITDRGNFGFFERQSARIAGAVSMYAISKMVLKKRHHIEDERVSLFEETRKWMREGVGAKNKFCGGDAPNIADISMFGVFRAVKTFQTFEDVCKEVPEFVPWYENMQKAVGLSSRTDGREN
jgi:microsomal prostaglandin-E synthase 2